MDDRSCTPRVTVPVTVTKFSTSSSSIFPSSDVLPIPTVQGITPKNTRPTYVPCVGECLDTSLMGLPRFSPIVYTTSCETRGSIWLSRKIFHIRSSTKASCCLGKACGVC